MTVQYNTTQQLEDTVLVAVLGVLFHPLQVLLMALEAPGVVLQLRRSSVTPLQAVVEHLSLLEPLQLLLTLQTEHGGERERDLQIKTYVSNAYNDNL